MLAKRAASSLTRLDMFRGMLTGSSSFLWFSSSSSQPIATFSSGSVDEVKSAINAGGLVVFSKSYCPFCIRVKGLFNELGVNATVFELDELASGDAAQESLVEITGQRSVPNVFIGGHHVGGCDDTFAALENGSLQTMLDKLGA